MLSTWVALEDWAAKTRNMIPLKTKLLKIQTCLKEKATTRLKAKSPEKKLKRVAKLITKSKKTSHLSILMLSMKLSKKRRQKTSTILRIRTLQTEVQPEETATLRDTINWAIELLPNQTSILLKTTKNVFLELHLIRETPSAEETPRAEPAKTRKQMTLIPRDTAWPFRMTFKETNRQ